MNSLQLYTVFHLNLSYSSIEEEQRLDVIRRCYWPLLRLATEYNLPLGIEASGYTLETAAAMDPSWLEELRRLTAGGPCEFIGSGYAQVIGPLVPAEVNVANLRLGHQLYERLLGFRPDIALINEQAYSASLVQHYLDAGYRAVVMEWDNPYRCHPEWDPEWRYLPQIACSQHGEEIPVIWNKAIAFQKFQRYVHDEIELNEYLEYLRKHLSEKSRSFPFYGNDVEIFNFRPGRFETEAVLKEDEWQRIDGLFKILLADGRFQFIRPSQVLEFMHAPGAGNRLHLESSEQPIPVKKQGKYNITRWAVAGRDDLGINTACWNIFEALRANPEADNDAWRELCYLWSSDFRTHITEKRWKAYLGRLREFKKKIGANHLQPDPQGAGKQAPNTPDSQLPPDVHVASNNGYLTVETDAIKIRLNRKRGLAIDALCFKSVSNDWLCGTLHHGYYDDINWGADFYTGHLVLESPGNPRITDLNPVDDVKVTYVQTNESVKVHTGIPLSCGKLYKTFNICARGNRPFVEIAYQVEWSRPMIGSLRLGYVTLNPAAFSQPSLFYATHNGGHDFEYFDMAKAVDHGDAVSFLVSANHVLGCTGGVIKLGDRQHNINVGVDKSASALAGMIQYQKIGDSYICRLIWTAREMDETSRLSGQPGEPLRCSLRVGAALWDSVEMR